MSDHQKSDKRPAVNLDSLQRIFTVPESDKSTLGRIEREISQNLLGFLKEHTVAAKTLPSELEQDFQDTLIPEDPIFVSEQAEFLLEKVVAQSVHTMAPSFVGHMTSALPYFMMPLAKIMFMLNQNVVKSETSKAFTPLERQVIGMMHRLLFRYDEAYYERFTHNYDVALGVICSNGTLANLSCLWVALNRLFPKDGDFDGIGDDGLPAALQHYGKKGVAIVVSERGHYSLKKSANLLGIGRKNLVTVPVDENNKILLPALSKTLDDLAQGQIAVAAVVGIAGTTETGNVDHLPEMAAICRARGLHFHVDAAWGGPTVFSEKYGHLLAGMEQADSITFDAHKQLYVPMGAGMALFRDNTALNAVEHHAQYIIRRGSRDLGRWTIEGGRPGMAMLIHSGLRIIGRRGYALLIDMGIEKAQAFATLIQQQNDFELISHPELNLLTYRFVPKAWRAALQDPSPAVVQQTNELLNNMTVSIQKEQRERGKTFVSRTTLTPVRYQGQAINVFRVVLANPLTSMDTLQDILNEQRQLGHELSQSMEERVAKP